MSCWKPVPCSGTRIGSTHAVTASDLNAGEDGTIDLGGDIFFDGISIAYKGPPARKVRIEATCQWTQVASGTLDISKDIARLFDDKKVRSLTSQGLHGGLAEGR